MVIDGKGGTKQERVGARRKMMMMVRIGEC